MSDHGHDGEFHSHGALYFKIFAALCVFTIISILADVFHGLVSKQVLIVVVLAVAACKALCVMLIFMHLKFERAWKYLLLAPTLILAATIPFALTPDVGSSYYTPTAPQISEYEAQEAAKAAGHHDGHGDGHAAEPAKHH